MNHEHLMDPSNDHGNDPGDGKIHYFLPGRCIVQLGHNPSITPNELAEATNAYLSQNTTWSDNFHAIEPASLLTFKMPETAFSIATVSTINPEVTENGLAELIGELVKGLDDQEVEISGGIKLKSFSPDWLIGGASHSAALGGPGGWPSKDGTSNRDWLKFQFSTNLELGESADNRGEGVQVHILDTAPCTHDLAEAYEHWHGRHPLFDGLLGPNGALHIYPATLAEHLEVSDYSAAGHRYQMTDHGLFIAGIIHTIAPKATLHLYEALNAYGIGSLETIARALLKALQAIDEQPELSHVVNFSLMLGVSHDGSLDRDLPDVLRDEKLLGNTRMSFEEMIAWLDRPNVLAAAAAGNDARPAGRGQRATAAGIHRPHARFPAAYKSVVGVGAVPKGYPKETSNRQAFRTATYSNVADNTDIQDKDFAILGGEFGSKLGVKSIYLGKFPRLRRLTPPKHRGDADILPDDVRYQDNNEGWAWWAGTSFATPIISGLLAAWWGAHPGSPADNARSFLSSAADGETDEQEKVIRVVQR